MPHPNFQKRIAIGLLFCIFISNNTYAQRVTVFAGPDFTGQFQWISNASDRYGFFGGAGVCAGIDISPAEEDSHASSLRLQGALLTETVPYGKGIGTTFALNKIDFEFNPQLLLPLGYSRMQLAVGIAVRYNAYLDVGYSERNGSAFIDLDTAYNEVSDHYRKITAEINLGLNYHIPLRRHSIELNIDCYQTCPGFLDDNVEVPYISNGITGALHIKYQPTYLRLGIFYRL